MLRQAKPEPEEEALEASGSEGDSSWVQWFCSLKGNEFFAEVDAEFMQDDFNLTGLSAQVPYYEYALDTVMDAESLATANFSKEQQESIESAAELLYGLIQVGYCHQLKRPPLLDLFCIASGFLLRAIAGAVAAMLPPSPWFLLTVGLLAPFLAIEKRKAELRVAQDRGVITRKVLERYSVPLLLRLESTVATSAFISYALWAAGPALRGAPTSWMLLTVPFVLVGIFRYQLLSDPEEAERRREWAPERSSEKPEEILLGDRGIQFTLAGWLVTTALIGLLSRAS